MRTFELLLEHNIINLPDLEQWVDEIAKRCHFPEGQEWIRSKFRKYLINSDATSDRVAGLTPNAPDWMKKRYEEGIPLHRFRPNNTVNEELSHIVDFLNSLHSYATQKHDEQLGQTLQKEAMSVLSKLQRFSVEQAALHSEKWFERLNRSHGVSSSDTSGNVKLVLRTSVGAWVELLNNEATKYEGAQMNHCVGGGSYTVGDGGRYRIFSLRDSKNEPHATVSMEKDGGDDLRIDQVKGKQNKAPIAKYQPAVIELLNLLHPEIRYNSNSDLERMGIRWKSDPETLNTVYGSIADVAEQVAEIDGVKVLKLTDVKKGGYETYRVDNYYIYRKHIYAKVKMNQKNQFEGIEWQEENHGVRRAVWAIIAQFFNSLDPVPEPASSVSGIDGPLLYKRGVYGKNREQFSELIGDLSDGSSIWQLTTDKVKVLDLYDKEGEHRLTIDQSSGTKRNGWNTDPTPIYQLDATRVKGVEPPPPETIIDAIALADLQGGVTSRLRNLGVWPKEITKNSAEDDGWSGNHEAFAAFTPERAGFVKIADGIYGGNLERDKRSYGDKSPLKAYLYNETGKKLGCIRYQDSSYNTARGLVEEVYNHHNEMTGAEQEKLKHDIEKALMANPQHVATWFNHIEWEAPTRPYQRDQFKPYHIVKKAGKWVAVTDAKPVAEYDGYAIKVVNKSITVTSPDGKIVILANKGREMLSGIKLVKIEGSYPTRHKALLVLDKYIQEYEADEWYIDYDAEEFARAMCVRGDDNRVIPALEKYPPRAIKTYPDGSNWAEIYLNPHDVHFKHGWATAGKYSLTAADGTLIARVFTTNKEIRSIIIRNAEEKKVGLATADSVLAILPSITDLMDEEKLGYDRDYFGRKLDVAVINGKVCPVADDARLQDFLRGRITYEDGKQWVKGDFYSGEKGKTFNWELRMEEEYEQGGEKKTREVTLARARLDADGLDKVQVNKNRQNPRQYIGYVMDLVELAYGKQDD